MCICLFMEFVYWIKYFVGGSGNSFIVYILVEGLKGLVYFLLICEYWLIVGLLSVLVLWEMI